MVLRMSAVGPMSVWSWMRIRKMLLHERLGAQKIAVRSVERKDTLSRIVVRRLVRKRKKRKRKKRKIYQIANYMHVISVTKNS